MFIYKEMHAYSARVRVCLCVCLSVSMCVRARYSTKINFEYQVRDR